MTRREFNSGVAAWVGAWAIERLLGEARAYPILRVKTDKPYVCIGIDDGWSPERVERFLKIADKYRVKFSLFPVGKVLLESPELWREVKAAGHQVGNHSHDHIYAPGKTKARIRWSFRTFEEDYEEVFGEAFPEPKIARVPFAEGVNQTVQEVLGEMGYLQVHWMKDSYSWRRDGVNSEENRKFALANIGVLEQGWIGVMHFTDLDMAILPALLDLLAERGLTNVPFSRLWEARKNK